VVTAAPACTALRKQWTEKCPNRDQSSDGILSSDAHQLQNPSSDHDYGNAVDITHDPLDGVDIHAWVRELVKQNDPRVKYVISNGQIWADNRSDEGWRLYTGENKHTKHAHISIYSYERDDVSTWFWYNPTGDNDMTDAQAQQLVDLRAGQDKLRRDVREIGNMLNKIAAGVGAPARLEILSAASLDNKIES